MAMNQRYTHNRHIALTALVDVAAGQPVKIGQYVGVAQTAALAGEKVTIWLDGSYDVTVTGAIAAQGAIVYITGANALTTTRAGNFEFGVANGTKAAGSGVVEVAPFGKITTIAALS